MTKPLVAIVGRPNVGKSTLFNRLVGHSKAIVSDSPGTTRDRITATIPWKEGSMILIDTGGIESSHMSEPLEQVMHQVDLAIEESDILLFVVDVNDGVTHQDIEIADSIRKLGKLSILTINKVDNHQKELQAMEFYQLALGDPLLISAYHNLGISDLLDELNNLLPPEPDTDDILEGPRFAILGRPNVGKSSLINAILGNDRTIVSSVPGTTRDSIDIQFHFDNEPISLIDTAGVRKSGKVESGIEKYSVLRTIRALENSDVCLLLTDASEILANQDTHIAGYIKDSFKGVVVVVNKWDLIQDQMTQEEATFEIRRRLKFIPYAPICFTSAINRIGVEDAVKTAIEVYRHGKTMISRSDLKRVLISALASHMPPSRGGKNLRISRMYQKDVSPPTFVTFVNNPELIHFSYRRYLENQLRLAFGFKGNPLQLIFSKRGR